MRSYTRVKTFKNGPLSTHSVDISEQAKQWVSYREGSSFRWWRRYARDSQPCCRVPRHTFCSLHDLISLQYHISWSMSLQTRNQVTNFLHITRIS